MTFAPSLDRGVPEKEAAWRRAQADLGRLLEDEEWRTIQKEKAAAAPNSAEKAAVNVREKACREALQAARPEVLAAVQAAAAARVAFKRQRAERSFRLALEPGSAVFFNT